MSQHTDREVALKDYLHTKGASLCPYRLDANFKIELGFDAIWVKYGCIKRFCSVWNDGAELCVLSNWINSNWIY